MSQAPWGLMACFDSPERLTAAARAARDAGYRRMDAYTPFPVEELDEALGLGERHWIPLIMLLGAITAGAFAYWLQWWTATVDFPINVGGRPLNSWPAFMVVTFELTVLGGALSGFFGWIALSHLPKPYHPVFNVESFGRVTRDRFFLCIEAADPRFDAEGTREFLAGLGPLEVAEVPP